MEPHDDHLHQSLINETITEEMMTGGFVKNKNVSRLDEVVMEYGSPRSRAD